METSWFITQLTLLGYIAIAMVLGGIIGFERELLSKPAGVRTHMLVAGAAALLISLGDALVSSTGQDVDQSMVRTDPVRLIEAIITGVSFLGAGTIIRNGRQGAVEGLTTAASLLVTAAVGVCVALAELVLAIGATLLVLVTLRVVRRIETRVDRKTPE